MSFVAVAIGGAAVVGAGASLAAGGMAASAQKEAAARDAQLQQAQNEEAKREYDLGRSDLAPYREAGYTALGQLGRGTADGGEFNRNFTLADFQQDPGYQFRQEQGQRGVEASASARGGVLSGGALKALDRYNQDYASSEYGAAYNRFNNDTTTRYNRLASVAGVGQQATNTGVAAGQQLTSTLQQGTSNLIASNDAAANARASSYVNAGQAVGGAANSIGQYYALKSLLPASSGGASVYGGTLGGIY